MFMEEKNEFLTATDIYKYLICPHWPWFDRFATEADLSKKRELTEGERKRLDDGYLHEKEVMERISASVEVREMDWKKNPKDAFEETKKAMQEGAEWIYQGTLMHGDWLGRPDILLRVPGASDIGNWQYVPIDIKSAHELKTTHMFQLVFYSILLKHTQGTFPEKAGIYNADNEEHFFDPSELIGSFKELIDRIEEIRKGEKPKPVVRKACFDTSPWGDACLAYAQETNDIAQIYNVDIRRLTSLRSLGIETVDDAAKMNPDEYANQAWGLTRHGLEVIRMQAQSLIDKIAFIRKSVPLTASPTEIYFDIESDLPNDVDYLYGFWMRKDGKEEYIRFIAEKPEDEETMWHEFLAWLETLPAEYTVYHYAPFEPMRLRLLEKRYGGSSWLDLFMSRFIDLKPYATKHIVLPLYFYSLKKICKYLGFDWRGELQSGGASIDYYERWCATGNRSILEEIIVYNEDDVRATAFLKDWLQSYAGEVTQYPFPYPWRR